MKKLACFGLIGLTLGLTGCAIGTAGKITYEGYEHDIEEVEDIIADRLEVENPNVTIDVEIDTKEIE